MRIRFAIVNHPSVRETNERGIIFGFRENAFAQLRLRVRVDPESPNNTTVMFWMLSPARRAGLAFN